MRAVLALPRRWSGVRVPQRPLTSAPTHMVLVRALEMPAESAGRCIVGTSPRKRAAWRKRGHGTFPAPAVRTTSRGRLWRWSQVAAWARRPAEEVDRAEWIAVLNARLQ